MKRSNPCLHAVVAVLKSAGITHRVEQGGKHLRVRFDVRGRRFSTTVPSTPSDYRSAQNARCQVRRKLRELEVAE